MSSASNYVRNSNTAIFDPQEHLPRPTEDSFISVVCGNTHLRWALHGSRQDRFQVTMYWTTPPPTEDMFDDDNNEEPSSQQEDPLNLLAINIPSQVQSCLFGTNLETKGANEDPDDISSRMMVRTVYIVSSSDKNCKAVQYMFSTLPTIRLVLFQNDSFLSKEQGLYESMGVDRAAAIYGAAAQTDASVPLMVWDGGTAMTYTAMTAASKIPDASAKAAVAMGLPKNGSSTPATDANKKPAVNEKGTAPPPPVAGSTEKKPVVNEKGTVPPPPVAGSTEKNGKPPAIAAATSNADSATTAAAVDANKNQGNNSDEKTNSVEYRTLLGGGISPGVGARFQSMSDYTGALPTIDFDMYAKYLGLDDLIGELGPLAALSRKMKTQANRDLKASSLFSLDTELAMASGVLTDVACYCNFVTNQFAQLHAKPNGSTTNSSSSINNDKRKGSPSKTKKMLKPTIYITGGDVDILHALLRMDPDKLRNQQIDAIIKTKKNQGDKNDRDDYDLYKTKGLCQLGIAELLLQWMDEIAPTQLGPDDELRDKLIGLRIAKTFPEPDYEDGDFVFRGTVMAAGRGSQKAGIDTDLFQVRYDDNDTEELDIRELHDALWLYQQVGEKDRSAVNVYTEEVKVVKKKSAGKAVTALLESSKELRENVAKEPPKKPEPPSTPVAAGGSAASAAPKPTAAASSSSKKRKKPAAAPAADAKKKTKKKKVATKQNIAQLYIGKRVAKNFPQEGDDGNLEAFWFFGTIDRCTQDVEPLLWHCKYDDDDAEEYDIKDMKEGLKNYEEYQQFDPKNK